MKRKRSSARQGAAEEAAAETRALPLICDLTCPHAGFAPASAVGACRRDQAVWCSRFARLNNKHTRCLGRKG